MSLLNSVSDQLNLKWAWEKVKSGSRPGDVWIDEVELAGFELKLEENLRSIQKEILSGKFELRPIKPMAFPKHPDNEGNERVRQYFHISIRDQVAWTALVNVIGPFVDRHMPTWSYGNRLYKSIWIEEDEEGVRFRKIGRYRRSSRHTYLPFQQSWPVFRRHVYLATRAMSGKESETQLSLEDQDEYELVSRTIRKEQCPFIFREYWDGSRGSKSGDELFWCSIDLEKFYPSVKLSVVKKNIVECLPVKYRAEAIVILGAMLTFSVDRTEVSDESLNRLGLKRNIKIFKNLPTGLQVSGFLANAALLKLDKKVNRKLRRNKKVAHFRYVDDHFVLAHSFEELEKWVGWYINALSSYDVGPKINKKKLEPKELAHYLEKKSQNGISSKKVKLKSAFENAKKSCLLDSDFPSPLMTKTLALVSSIGRTNFNLLEKAELSSLVDQLEHMLLVDIPETEIPERTRLAFAASKLAQVAQNKLANHISVFDSSEISKNAMKRKNIEEFELTEPPGKAKSYSDADESLLRQELERIFDLLLKVLRDRPDRVRLWTRAILLCRQTGVKRLKNILGEVDAVKKKNELAADYLMANTLALLGSNILFAARLATDRDVADWRKIASLSFIQDSISTDIKPPHGITAKSDLRVSWTQYCFGVYCAFLILQRHKSKLGGNTITFPKSILEVGKASLIQENKASWAWWAVRPIISDYRSKQDGLVTELGIALGSSRKAYSYWNFFPDRVPEEVLKKMCNNRSLNEGKTISEGWWYDALLNSGKWNEISSGRIKTGSIAQVRNNFLYVEEHSEKYITLYEWVSYLQELSISQSSDPRASEWTALEITRQIIHFFNEELIFSEEYINNSLVSDSDSYQFAFHPANFIVPRTWIEGSSLSWHDWVSKIRNNGDDIAIKQVPKSAILLDKRYTPLDQGNSISDSINPIRGFGVMLCCLLRRSFDLPPVWNGPGHSDVLTWLPRFLLKRITCSSLTLGVLQSCLQARVTENILNLRKPKTHDFFFDDDSGHDPIHLIQLRDLSSVIAKCQKELENYQLSTLNNKARQLTPVNVRLLTDPEWGNIFSTEDLEQDD